MLHLADLVIKKDYVYHRWKKVILVDGHWKLVVSEFICFYVTRINHFIFRTIQIYTNSFAMASDFVTSWLTTHSSKDLGDLSQSDPSITEPISYMNRSDTVTLVLNVSLR